MSFLPQDYKAPRSSSGFYMKLQEGENKIRILSQPVMGWEDWDNKTPMRYNMDEKPKTAIDPKKPIKHFWSFIVWNYSMEQIQILHITQASIRNSLETFSKDTDWGHPSFYDVKIIKTGEGKETEYAMTPLPHKPVSQAVKDAFSQRKCNLEALFVNQDPFGEWKEYTKGIFSKEDLENIPQQKSSFGPTISELQVEDLGEILAGCDGKYIEKFWVALKELVPTAKELSHVPVKYYDRMMKAATKNRDANKSKEKQEIAA